jgi:hypothetical protein
MVAENNQARLAHRIFDTRTQAGWKESPAKPGDGVRFLVTLGLLDPAVPEVNTTPNFLNVQLHGPNYSCLFLFSHQFDFFLFATLSCFKIHKIGLVE